MTENISNLQPFFSAAITFIFSIVYFFITNSLKERKKAARDIWIKFLNSNKYINECIHQYNKIESPQNIWTISVMIIGSFLGSFYYIYSLIVTSYVFNILNVTNSWSPIYSTLIVLLFALIMTITTNNVIEKRNKDKTLLNESGRIGNLIVFVNWFIFTTLLSTLFFYGAAITQTKNFDIITNDIIGINKGIYGSSIILLILAITISYVNHRLLLNYSKILLNSKYLNRFPYVRITTNYSEIEGKISEIFDDNLINLECGRFRNAVEWDAITRLELRKF